MSLTSRGCRRRSVQRFEDSSIGCAQAALHEKARRLMLLKIERSTPRML
jgi:hypothetical protein